MSLFAVAGVSGNTGRVVADFLLAHGHGVRVIVRDAAKGQAWKDRGAEVAIADVGDATALAKALEGVDGAYLLLPPNFATGDFRAYQGRTGKAIVEAVDRASVRHVVFLSSIGAELPSGTGPIAGLYPIEAGLRGLPNTSVSFVRAAPFMENLLSSLGMLSQGLFPSFTPKDHAIVMIASRDIGEVAAALLIEGPPPVETPRIVELGGAPVSSSDVAAALSALVGRPVNVAEVPVSTMSKTLQGYGMPADVTDLYQEMTEAINKGLLAYSGAGRTAKGRIDLATFLAGALPKQ